MAGVVDVLKPQTFEGWDDDLRFFFSFPIHKQVKQGHGLSIFSLLFYYYYCYIIIIIIYYYYYVIIIILLLLLVLLLLLLLFSVF